MELLLVFLQIRQHFVYGHAVYSRRSAVPLDPLVRRVQVVPVQYLSEQAD